MATNNDEEGSRDLTSPGETMPIDNMQPPEETVETIHPSAGTQDPSATAGVGNDFEIHVGGAVSRTSQTPVADFTYGTPSTCYMYGVCSVVPVPENRERVASEDQGVEWKMKEGGQLVKYMYHYSPPTYLPIPQVHTGNAHITSFSPPTGSVPYSVPDSVPYPVPAPAIASVPLPYAPPATSASPLMLVNPLTSSPPSAAAAALPHNNEEIIQGNHTPYNDIGSPEEANLQPPFPPFSTQPQHFYPIGSYNNFFMDENKTGIYGDNGCWYSLAGIKNNFVTPDHLPILPQPCHPLFENCNTHIPPTSMTSNGSTSPSTSSSTPPFASSNWTVIHQQSSVKKEEIQGGVMYYNHYQHLDLPMYVLGKPHLINFNKKEGRMSLQDLWDQHMTVLFKHLPDKWLLSLALHERRINASWHCFRDLAKVRFYCKLCNDGWTSMNGLVVFYYRWNKKILHGEILYKVAGQMCSGDCTSKSFLLPFWYPEEAQKVITNIYYKISSEYYNLVTPKLIKSRRHGKPAKHHSHELCEGCAQGICKMD